MNLGENTIVMNDESDLQIPVWTREALVAELGEPIDTSQMQQAQITVFAADSNGSRTELPGEPLEGLTWQCGDTPEERCSAAKAGGCRRTRGVVLT